MNALQPPHTGLPGPCNQRVVEAAAVCLTPVSGVDAKFIDAVVASAVILDSYSNNDYHYRHRFLYIEQTAVRRTNSIRKLRSPTMTDTAMTLDADEVLGEVTRNWGWMLAVGIVMVILGTIGLGMTFALTMASVIFFGVLMLIGGGIQLVDAFKCKGWKSVLWHILIALLYLAGGAVIIRDPVLASTTLTLFIASVILGTGIFRVIIAFQMRGMPGWAWVLISGIVAIALGIMIFARWPVSGLWVIGLFVAIEMLFNGWSQITIALAARAASKARA